MAEETPKTTDTVDTVPGAPANTTVAQTVDEAAAAPAPETPAKNPADEVAELKRTMADMTLEMEALKKAAADTPPTDTPPAGTPPADTPPTDTPPTGTPPAEDEKPYDPYLGKPTGDARLDAMEKQMQEIGIKQQLDAYVLEHNLNPDDRAAIEKMLPETGNNIAVAHAAAIGKDELRQAQGGAPETVVNPTQYDSTPTDDIAAEKDAFYKQAIAEAQRAKIPPLT